MADNTVLIVDDDNDMLDVLKTTIETVGFEPLLAHDGEEGWQQYIKHEPPLVISDIYMPKKNGVNLLEDIKKHKNDTVVILITGYAHYRELTENSVYPPDAFLSKPFSLNELVETIKNVYGKLPN